MSIFLVILNIKRVKSLYLKNNTYSKNTTFGEIYSFTGMEKIKIIEDAYIQGYKDALKNE